MIEWPSDYSTEDTQDPLQRRTPFIGRTAAFARLSQVLNTSHSGALMYIGAEGVGKTALLYAIDQHMTVNQIGVGVFIPLESLPTHKNELALALYQAAYGALIADRGIAALPSRLPTPPINDDVTPDWMEWLADTGLPGIRHAMRPGRRLIFLLDDAQVWMDAIEQKLLSADFPAVVAGMIAPHSDTITLVFTVDQDEEQRLKLLAPLIQPEHTMRLTQLTEDEIHTAFTEERAAHDLYRWTGGHAELIAAYLRIESPRKLSINHIETMTPQVYSRHQAVFQRWWEGLSPQERRVLTAISTAQYIDPFKAVTAAEIQAWLVQTEHPMDMTAIQAALRGLEYRELVVYDAGTARGVRLKSDLFRRWLREHGGFDSAESADRPNAARLGGLASVGNLSRQQMTMVGIGVVVVLALILIVVLTTPAPESSGRYEAAMPTVTLAAPTP